MEWKTENHAVITVYYSALVRVFPRIKDDNLPEEWEESSWDSYHDTDMPWANTIQFFSGNPETLNQARGIVENMFKEYKKLACIGKYKIETEVKENKIYGVIDVYFNFAGIHEELPPYKFRDCLPETWTYHFIPNKYNLEMKWAKQYMSFSGNANTMQEVYSIVKKVFKQYLINGIIERYEIEEDECEEDEE